MVVLFKGTDKAKNFSPQALALSAGLSATKYYKKTLVMQLTTKYPVEGYMMGKRIKEQYINDNLYLFDDTGIDSLTRRAGITTFNEDHFQNAVIPTVSSENLLDILPVSKKIEADVERETIKDPALIGTIIQSASKIYDNIFILGNGKCKEVIEAILPYVDKTVTCVSQGIKEEISAPATKEEYFLVTGFDYKSSYSAHVMQKIYGLKNIYIMPYNVEFKDAYTQNNMLQYILHNNQPESSDYAYHLITEMLKLVKVIIGEAEEEYDDAYRFTAKSLVRTVNALTQVSGDEIEFEVEPKRFLKPERVTVHKVSDRLEEADEDGYEDEYEEEAEYDYDEYSENEGDDLVEADEDDCEVEDKKSKKKDKKSKKEKKHLFGKKKAKAVSVEDEEPEEDELEEDEFEDEADEFEEYEESYDEDDDDFYEDDDEEEYEPEPEPVKPAKSKKKKTPVLDETTKQALMLIDAGYSPIEVTMQTGLSKTQIEEALSNRGMGEK